MKKNCLECDEPITGRVDKKFCCDQCRNTYNNKLNKDTTNLVRNINNILRKNRRILAEFNPDGKAKVKMSHLESKGFRQKYHTHVYITKTGNEYFFCYEYGYLILEDGFAALVRRDEYEI